MVSSISNLPYTKRLKALDITTLVERRKRQQYRENFFFNRTANLWNALPSEIVQAPSATVLKQALIAG